MYRPPAPFPDWSRPEFNEADWIREALLMGSRLGLIDLDAEYEASGEDPGGVSTRNSS